jgi:hypothetical protein
MTVDHNPRVHGYPGCRRLAKTISQTWYWPRLSRDCVLFVKKCPSFQAARLKYGPKKTVPMCNFPPAGPLEFIAMTVLGPLTVTARGNQYVLVIVGMFPMLVRTIPLDNISAVTVACAYVDGWITMYGAYTVVLTENGTL